jgi:hypothetical protein
VLWDDTALLIDCLHAKGEPAVNQALISRFNFWLLVAFVAVLVVVAAVLLGPTAMHAMNGMLQGPQRMAPLCGVSYGPC